MNNDDLMLRPGDIVNLIQRQAVELSRMLDAPSAEFHPAYVVEHIERMLAFAQTLNSALAENQQSANGAHLAS